MKDVDIIITAFERPECLRNLVGSIPDMYIRNVTIGDQSRSYPPDFLWSSLRYLCLPHDCGLSSARNQLVLRTYRDYILLLEDDFEWTDKTDIGKMVKLMEMDETIGVVGGAVIQKDIRIPFEFIPTVEDGVLYHSSDGDHWEEYNGIKYKETGSVMNFALFRRELFKDVMWDPELKLREHQDFYVRLARTKWRVLFTPDVEIKDAKPARPSATYKAFKDRDEFLVLMMQKNNIHKIKYQNGACRELVDGGIKKYKEAPLST
jgi:GT2 family glycosyltransferase